MTAVGKLSGKVVAITGGTSGIGRALLEQCIAEGASLATCARSPAALDTLSRAHPEVLRVVADVTNPEHRTGFLDAIDARFGRLDILVSNAGVLVERDFANETIAEAALADEFALNLVAPVQLAAAVLARFPTLQAIVLVSSGYALVAPRRSPTYGAAKAGLHAFAEGLRRQVRPRGVHVLEVLPPAVNTRAIAHRNVRKVSPEEVARATLDALHRRQSIMLIGAVRFLPALLRLAPGLVSDRVAET